MFRNFFERRPTETPKKSSAPEANTPISPVGTKGEVPSFKDLTPQQREAIEQRMERVLRNMRQHE